MNVIIIEDEQPAFTRLKKLLEEHVQGSNLLAHLDSVVGSKKWFEENDQPDVVFMDIHLADGSAFDLLEQTQIEAPVIFTTAYDQYAIDAFKANSIGYLLKPIKADELKETLNKLNSFKQLFNPAQKETQELLEAIMPASYKKRFLIRFGDNIKTLSTKEIAYFFSENKSTFAKTLEGRTYPMDQNLDKLEQVLDPEDFFRLNRQYIISMDAIAEMKAYSKSRVLVKLNPESKEPPLVSSERSSTFKKWLDGEL